MKRVSENGFYGPGLAADESGSALIVALLVLVAVTVIGLAAVNTSSIEIRIARNARVYQQNFYRAENANKNEAYKVGHSSEPWYEITDPSNYGKLLYPSGFTGLDVNDPETWPQSDLLGNSVEDKYDYAYLVKYLYSDNPPKGYDASKFTGYKFRINSNRQVEIETGGTKVGVKATGF